jgi:hypothetical protein
LLIWVVPPAMVSERDDSRWSATGPCAQWAGGRTPTREFSHLGPRSWPGSPSRARHRVQRRRYRSFAHQLEVGDADGDLRSRRKVPASSGRPAVDHVVSQIDQILQLRASVRRGGRPGAQI